MTSAVDLKTQQDNDDYCRKIKLELVITDSKNNKAGFYLDETNVLKRKVQTGRGGSIIKLLPAVMIPTACHLGISRH